MEIQITKVGLASDHAGYELKQFVKTYLDKLKLPYKDFGSFSSESCDYPDYAHPLAESIEKDECQIGIAICGSGEGMSITLNKHQHIRASLCWIPEIAEITRKHNKSNVLVIPARFISQDTAKAILDKFFSSDFEGGRHQRRIEKIAIN